MIFHNLTKFGVLHNFFDSINPKDFEKKKNGKVKTWANSKCYFPFSNFNLETHPINQLSFLNNLNESRTNRMRFMKNLV